MKRNMDLIRAVLLAMEEHEHGRAPDIEIEGYTEEEIGYHAYLLDQAGMIVAIDTTDRGSESPEASPLQMTWAGHDFLDASRSPGIWNQAKDMVDKVGGASMAVWVAVLTSLVKKNLGLE